MKTDTHAAKTQIWNALIVAAVFLAFSAALRFLAPAQLSHDARQRLLGVAMGMLVVYYGNVAAKTLTPLARLRCNPATEQRLRRFCAWGITLGGVGYIIAFLSAPIAYADVLASAILGAAVLLVIVRIVWTKLRGTRS